MGGRGKLGDGEAGHARGADPGQGGEQVQVVHAAGHFDRQHGTGEPCATPRLRAETPLAPQDGTPAGRMARSYTLLVGSTPGTSRYVHKTGHRSSGLAPILRTVMGLGADGADGWEASKATGLR